MLKAIYTKSLNVSPPRRLFRKFLYKVYGRLNRYFGQDETILFKHLARNQQWNVGDYSYGDPETKSPRVVYYGEDLSLEVGNYCSFASDIVIVFGGYHRTDWVTTYPFSYLFDGVEKVSGLPHAKGNIKIGNDVWVCTGAMILSGVTIGNGAVIAAGSVVVKDVPAYTVVAGNPARVVKQRFPDDVIEKLERIQWWSWPEEKIRSELPILLSSNVTEFVEKHDL